MSWHYIEDIEEKHAPPTKPLLRLSVIDDLLSLVIVEPGEKEQEFTEKAEVIVPLVSVMWAITAARADVADRARERAK